MKMVFEAGNINPVTLEDDAGQPVRSLAAVNFSAECGEVPKLELTLVATPLELFGVRPQYMVGDPVDGCLKAVEKITFADGSIFEARAHQ